MHEPSQVPSEIEQRLAKALDEISTRLTSGDDMSNLDEILLDYPELSDELSELRPMLDQLAIWGEDAVSLTDTKQPSPRVLGDFRIVEEVGRGGMGIVYEAEQITLDRRVALKVLPFAAFLDERQLRRFQTEARAAATLQHDNIVSVYSVGCERGVHYYAMQLIQGVDLSQVSRSLRVEAESATTGQPDTQPIATLSTQRNTDPDQYFRNVASIGAQAASALHYAHSEGVVHRDIKPANLLLDRQGNVHITDFGLARFHSSEQSLTKSGDFMGTLRYMSPEQVSGTQVVDHRTDIYSLGATLYELSSMVPVFQSDERQRLIHDVLYEEPPDLLRVSREIPRDLATIIQKAMRKEPDERYSNAGELAADLRRYTGHRPILARPVTQLERITKFSRRNPMLTLVTGLLLVVLALGSVAFAWSYSRDAKRAALGAELLEREVYAGDMLLARTSLDEGDYVETERLLLKWVPNDSGKQNGELDLRGWEWFFLWNQCHDSTIQHTFSHPMTGKCVAWSPDSKRLFDGAFSGEIPIWDVSNGRPALVTKLTSPLGGPFLARTYENRVFFTNWNGDVFCYNWDTGAQKHIFSFGHIAYTRSIELSGDGSLLAVSALDDENTSRIIIWDFEHQRIISHIDGGVGSTHVVFDAQNQLIVASDLASEVQTIDPTTGKLLQRATMPGNVIRVAAAPDKHSLYALVQEQIGETSYQLYLANPAGGSDWIRKCFVGVSRPKCIAVHPDGGELVIGTADGYLKFVDLDSARLVSKLYHTQGVRHVAYAPSGNHLASTGWDCKTHLICRERKLSPKRTQLEIPRDGASITKLTANDQIDGVHVGFLDNSTVVSTAGGRLVRLWDAYSGEIKDEFELAPGHWNQIHFGVDTKRQRLALVRSQFPPQRDESGEHLPSQLCVWDFGSKRLWKDKIDIPASAPTVIPFSHDGRYVAIPGIYHTTIVDLRTKQKRTIKFDSWVKACAFTPGDQELVCAPGTGLIRYFDLETLNENRKSILMDTVSTGCLKFSPDGHWLASAGFGNRIRILNRKTGEIIDGEECPRYLGTLAFTPDGRRIATGSMDGRVRLFSTLTGHELFRIDVRPYYSYVCFSPNGESLAIWSGNEGFVVHAPHQEDISTLSKSELNEIFVRDTTRYGE